MIRNTWISNNVSIVRTDSGLFTVSIFICIWPETFLLCVSVSNQQNCNRYRYGRDIVLICNSAGMIQCNTWVPRNATVKSDLTTHSGHENCRPLLYSPLDPIVNGSCKNCCVGSLSKIFHQNMMLIYSLWHKLTSKEGGLTLISKMPS